MRKLPLLTLLFVPVLLAACSLVDVKEPTIPEDEIEDIDDTAVPETQNVTYTGEVQPAGISIYQQGSHRLALDDGKFILLESNTIDLNGYVGESVTITGALRPTVEAGGMIMRVTRITLSASSESSDSSASSENASSEISSEISSELSSEAMSSSTESVLSSEVTVSSASSTTSVSSVSSISSDSSSSSESSISSPPEEQSELVEIMARQEYGAEHWTQQYCTTHIGFCVPVHRNWWFKSFGATNSTLWHVEFSAEPIEELNQGPIVVDLVAGSNEDMDGAVVMENGMVIGYREWTFGRHFRIYGHESLEVAVRYMTQNIIEYNQ